MKTISTIKQHAPHTGIPSSQKEKPCVCMSRLLLSPAGLMQKCAEAFEVSSHHTLCLMKCYQAWSLNGLCHYENKANREPCALRTWLLAHLSEGKARLRGCSEALVCQDFKDAIDTPCFYRRSDQIAHTVLPLWLSKLF